MSKTNKERLQDNNLELESIKAGIESLPPKQDLSAELTAQETYIAQLEAIIDEKASGGSVEPNIFVQDTEPTTKDGIWLKMSNTTPEHYISDDNIFIGGTWSNAGETADIPYAFNYSQSTGIGTNIYLFGGSGISNATYKYDTLTNIYTQLTDVPYSNMTSGTVVSIGTDIYVLGGNGNKRANYKYDTLTDTYTKMTDIPYDFYNSCAVAIGTNIYLLGGGNTSSSISYYNYKYDTLADNYTKLSNIPYVFYQSYAAAVNNDIYLFGSPYSNIKTVYKYNTLTDTYSSVSTSPRLFYLSNGVSVSDDIYIFGGSDGPSSAYKFNTLTNTFTQLTNIPYNFSRGSVSYSNAGIYLLGGTDTGTTTRKYRLESKTYEVNNAVVIYNNTIYKTKLFDTEFESDYQPLYGFADAWYYTTQGGLDGTMPVYYGNGTNWINIKNPPSNFEEIEEEEE